MSDDVMPVAATAPVAQQRRDGVVVLQPRGPLDEALADELRLLALEAHAPVVIDLDRCPRFEASAIDRLASAWQLHRPQLTLVAGDAGDRMMLERLASTWSVRVFSGVEDAIEARRRGVDGWAARPGA